MTHNTDIGTTIEQDPPIFDAATVWAGVVTLSSPEASDASSFNAAVAGVHPISVDDVSLTLAAGNKFHRDWMMGAYGAVLEKAVERVTGHPLAINVILDESIVIEQISPKSPDVSDILPPQEVSPKPKETLKKNIFDSKYTFDSFIVGDTNEFARHASLAVAEQPGIKYNPLFLWGGAGLGKTHLLQAIGNYVTENFPYKNVVYVTAEEFLNDFTGSVRYNTPDEFRKFYRQADVLLVDDIQFFDGKLKTFEQFFHTFNHLKDHNKQIVIASDRAPGEFTMDERMVSRFSQGLQADIQPPSYEIRLAILQQFVEKQRIEVDSDALSYIAEKSSGNIREMEGAITRVIAYTELTRGSRVTRHIVEEVTRGFFKDKIKKTISIATIQKEVCSYYGINHADLIGKKRTQDIITPRHMAMYLSQELTDNSYPQIGKAFGDRDHTTIMHAVSKIKKKMSSEPETYAQIDYLTNKIKK